MRNLKLRYCQEVLIRLPDVQFILFNTNTSCSNDLVYLVSTCKIYEFRKDSGTVRELAEVPGIISAEYLALENHICLATDGGEVLVVNVETGGIIEGTFCDVGIECMRWSPEQEVVAFVTKTHKVVVMTCTYDVIAEHTLSEQCSGEGQFITVGWGKKETQFHGSEGKMAAHRKGDFQAPESVEGLSQDVELTWREDGAYFAVSFISVEVGRMFKVFDKEGKLLYTSEKMNGLLPAIAWRPSGTWIAVPQLLPNKSTVALFEKNGLRHREIVLPFDLAQNEVVSLKWSTDSDILVIETKCVENGAQNLYLYTIGNYHWYLKQVLNFSKEEKIVFYCWDVRIGEEKTLHVLLQSGKLLVYSWLFGIDKYERSGVVAVIDGKRLLLTDFSKVVVPPPMCSKELQLDNYINACAFIANEKEQLQLCLLDVEKQLHLFKSPLHTAPLSFEMCHIFAAQEPAILPFCLSNLFWCSENHLLASTSIAGHSKLLILALDCEEADTHAQYRIENVLQLGGTVCALSKGSAELEHLFAQTLNGEVQQLQLRTDKTLKVDRLYSRLEQSALQLQWHSASNFEAVGLIALTSSQCLYMDAQRLDTDVTSICLAGNYLAFTKVSSLHFLRLSDRRVVAERKLERGGKLITTIANDSRVILQMPRGNLEAINPRVLVLELVAALLDRKCYRAAMDMVRKQRINLNIICDHNVCDFVDNLDVFLDEIKNPHWLNLFLSDLQNENFTLTMYASNYVEGSQEYPEGFKLEEKVAYLCDKLRECMEQRGEQRFQLPIITAYVKLGKLEKALELIWQEKRQPSSALTNNDGEVIDLADAALKYLLYLVDVNDLYNVALGTYDFGLVLFVAQKSQKDPKEYLPFLNELKKYEPNYCKFKIDEYLRRYERALEHISHIGVDKFEEALSFIKQHLLYKYALKFYAKQPECYAQVCLAFADHLRANGKLENASIMYERGGNLTQAFFSAKNGLDWQRALALAKQDNTQDVGSVALSLVPSLQENSKYLEAYQLLKVYGSSFAEALQSLLKGKLYMQAIFEARMEEYKHSTETQDSIESLIRSDLLSYRSLLEENLHADQELFTSYKKRLLDIRAKKAKQARMGESEPEHMELDECDLLSDTTSMRSSRFTGSSTGTGKTFRSSKNRRKHERKLLSLKPGNPFEDIALIDALHGLITKVLNQQQHVRDTCKALLELRLDAEAAAVQQRFKQLLQLLQRSLDEIWIAEVMTTQQFLTGPNIDYTQLQNEQRYALINPQKRFKPILNIIDWEHEILR